VVDASRKSIALLAGAGIVVAGVASLTDELTSASPSAHPW
jgi:hypothetical protein